jgi:D-alanyl-D-alanine-carboxypeptidase/D-alanyl-D-alanine-endopeptidase
VKLPNERKEITVDAKVLARYVGTYQLTPDLKMAITLDGNQLSEKLGEQPSFPIFPESETLFFLKVVDAEIEFVQESSGKVTRLVLHQNGDREAPKISDKAELPPPRKEIQVAAEILSHYVGTYELQPGVEVVMTLEDGQLMTQLTGQPKFPMFAESEDSFFLKVVDAKVTFVKGAQGAVNKLLIHQGGRDMEANRK